jgi:hypothetical protein
MSYQPAYTPRFDKRYQAFHSLHSRIEKVVAQVIADPYAGTEQLGKKGKLNLKGCRSAHVGMNWHHLCGLRNVEKSLNVSTAFATGCLIRQLSF